MKKSFKPFIIIWSSLLTLVVVIILIHIYFKLQNDNLVRNKTLTAEEISNQKNIQVNLHASLEQLAAEDRIVSIAYEELGLIKDSSEVLVVKIDKANADEISEQINSRYE
ncbi:MAG TPA: hypothetical protein VFF33_07890 [Ignavibacteriaceae bacterium]|nr:hypothetical protein [Ignavibacteriaceae bacterium]